jgi:hypothetical protein
VKPIFFLHQWWNRCASASEVLCWWIRMEILLAGRPLGAVPIVVSTISLLKHKESPDDRCHCHRQAASNCHAQCRTAEQRASEMAAKCTEGGEADKGQH